MSDPYSTVVDATIVGLQQGKDALIPLTLTLPAGVTDTERIDLAADDQIFMSVIQRTISPSGSISEKEVFAVTGAEVTVIPADHRIILKISRANTLTLKPDKTAEKINLYGTLYILKANGDSRPSSKIDLYMPVERAFV